MKVFVTGGTGLVGSNVIKVAREKYGAEVVASVYKRRPASRLHCSLEQVDVTDAEEVRRTLLRHRPDAVIHCAATVDMALLQQDNAHGWRLMVDATRNIARACGECGARMVFVSSDWVFGGGTPPYSEDAVPCPVNYYGLLKVVGETIVSSIGIDYGIARIAAVYGRNWSFPDWVPEQRVTGFGTLPNWMLDQLQKGERIVEWTDYINVEANPTLASDCAEAMLTIVERKKVGTFHCCGRRSVNRVELGKLVAATFGLDPAKVRAARAEEMDPGSVEESVPRKTSLNVALTESTLERRNLPPEEGLAVWKRQLQSGRLMEQRSSEETE
ncbi:MAG: SDR family oxidoreductase [Spirochaetaceae bacterium]|nr:MAG: SDR family oxidoreductase [Spirochaetaceae bacterium]